MSLDHIHENLFNYQTKNINVSKTKKTHKLGDFFNKNRELKYILFNYKNKLSDNIFHNNDLLDYHFNKYINYEIEKQGLVGVFYILSDNDKVNILLKSDYNYYLTNRELDLLTKTLINYNKLRGGKFVDLMNASKKPCNNSEDQKLINDSWKEFIGSIDKSEFGRKLNSILAQSNMKVQLEPQKTGATGFYYEISKIDDSIIQNCHCGRINCQTHLSIHHTHLVGTGTSMGALHVVCETQPSEGQAREDKYSIIIVNSYFNKLNVPLDADPFTLVQFDFGLPIESDPPTIADIVNKAVKNFMNDYNIKFIEKQKKDYEKRFASNLEIFKYSEINYLIRYKLLSFFEKDLPQYLHNLLQPVIKMPEYDKYSKDDIIAEIGKINDNLEQAKKIKYNTKQGVKALRQLLIDYKQSELEELSKLSKQFEKLFVDYDESTLKLNNLLTSSRPKNLHDPQIEKKREVWDAFNEIIDKTKEIFEKKKTDIQFLNDVLIFLKDNKENEIIPVINLIHYISNDQDSGPIDAKIKEQIDKASTKHINPTDSLTKINKFPFSIKSKKTNQDPNILKICTICYNVGHYNDDCNSIKENAHFMYYKTISKSFNMYVQQLIDKITELKPQSAGKKKSRKNLLKKITSRRL